MQRLGDIYARVRDPHPVALDVLLGVGLAIVGAVLEIVPPQEGYRDGNLLSIGLALAATLPLVWRRRRAGVVFAATATAGLVHALLLFPGGGPFFGLLFALYALSAYGPQIAARVGLAVLLVLQPLVAARDPHLNGWGDMVVGVIMFVAAWVLGDSRRVRRLHLETVEERAARLERERDEQARLAVQEERSRIAREMHDIVAHNVSVMVVQAGAARRMIGRDGAAAAEAVAHIETTGRAALDEMRRALGVVRSDTDAPEAPAGRVPQPGLRELPALVATCREAGLDVSLRTQGEERALPTVVGVTAYRIVQEALTNTMKHAGPARAVVALTYEHNALDVVVADDGRGATTGAHQGGHGLAGMRERVAVFGGALRVGPRLGGGFRVHARLPLERPSAALASRATG